MVLIIGGDRDAFLPIAFLGANKMNSHKSYGEGECNESMHREKLSLAGAR